MAGLTVRALRRRQARASGAAASAMPGASFGSVLRRVLAQRGADEASQDYSLQHLLPWKELKGIDVAAQALAEALKSDQRILIVGDYDADGATGVALAVSVLREFGATAVDYLVPDRQRFGYGLSPALAEQAQSLAPDLIVTVDNGISSVEGIRRLREQGIPVIVTDHHLPGEELPQALAIVNPNQPGDSFPSKALAGVGVMFYLLLALRQQLLNDGYFAASAPNMARHLDLVSVGTVADLVPLDRNNRILVEQGLRRMRAGLARPGLQALIDIARRQTADLQASDLGFAIGPRINAAGRLEHMDCGIACLLATDLPQARPLAEELDQINQSRRALQADMQDMALDQVLRQCSTEESPALCVYDPSWHEGVVGLVASQLKEKFHRPVLAFAKSQDGGLKGSGRSIPGFHLRDALALLDARHPGLIDKFGGHAMAAGLSVPANRLDEIREQFTDICREGLSADDLNPVWLSDGELAAHELNLETARELRQAGPWGQAWEEPVFDNRFELLEQRIVGQGHLKLKLRLADQGQEIDGIAFGVDERIAQRQLHLVYQLDINDYFSPARPQLIVRGAVEAA